MILFHVYEETGERTDRGALIYRHIFVMARGREDAKRKAKPYLKGDPDWVVVKPLSKPGEHISLIS